MIEDKEGDKPDYNNPKNWYLWSFYYNPNDKRIFPPKRIKWLGWTVNFANPYSIGAFVLLIVVMIFIARLIK